MWLQHHHLKDRSDGESQKNSLMAISPVTLDRSSSRVDEAEARTRSSGQQATTWEHSQSPVGATPRPLEAGDLYSSTAESVGNRHLTAESLTQDKKAASRSLAPSSGGEWGANV